MAFGIRSWMTDGVAGGDDDGVSYRSCRLDTSFEAPSSFAFVFVASGNDDGYLELWESLSLGWAGLSGISGITSCVRR